MVSPQIIKQITRSGTVFARGGIEANTGFWIKTMIHGGKTIQNNALAALVQRAGADTTAAIRTASLKTGVDFAYMMEKAAAESSFDSTAKARTSSATGLYQFIESTWLQMVQRYGDRHGLGALADRIDERGRVADPALRREILDLRNDPDIAALMAGEFAAENKRSLIRAGIPENEIEATELYLAHFLGAGAAGEFLKSMRENPLTAAADLFPRAAKANHNVFYKPGTQEARSLADIHAFFKNKFRASEGANGNSNMTGAMMTAGITPPPLPAARMAATQKPTPVQVAAPRLSPELMAYLNGTQQARIDMPTPYHMMQEDALRTLAARQYQNQISAQNRLIPLTRTIMAPTMMLAQATR